MKVQTKHNLNQARQRGFTLIELIMTLAVASIILTQAIPSFTTMINNNRLVTQTNDLVADINVARAEAVTRGVRVVLCNSADSRASGAGCDGTSGDWSTGWLMYANDDGTAGYDSSNDTLIRIGQPPDSTITVKANTAGNTDLQFNGDGSTNEGGSTVTFAVCDGRGVSEGRQINVNSVGRTRLISGSITSCL